MSSGGFTLGDLLGLKVAECRVHGCTRTWTDLSSNPKFGDAGGSDETKGMCEACKRRWPKLVDRDMPCAREGCGGSWKLSRQTQLENQAAGRPDGRHFCTDCDDKLKNLEPIEATCSVPDCGRTARLTPKQQLLGVGGSIDLVEGGITFGGALCKRCAEKGPYLKDVEAPCGIQKCKRTFTWKADEQISAFASGKPNIPPRRMCTTCRESFGKLLDRDVRCRASGCKKTWHWTREQQLDACVADKPLPKPPSHLCEDCFKVWNGLKDVERPCRRTGCKNTWIEKRGAQLARTLRGKAGDPFPQFCESCAGEVEHLKDREVPCKTEGCKRCWTWTAQQQFVAGVRPEALPPIKEVRVETAAPKAIPTAENPSGEAPTRRRRRRGPKAEVAAAGAPVDEAIVASEAVAEPDQASDVPAVVAVEPIQAAEEADEATTDEAAEGDETEEATEAAEVAVAGQTVPASKKKRRRRKRKNSVRPPSRHCGFCTDFLAKHKTAELPCASCGTPIFWPPESQLQTQLGNWEMPKLCGACKRDLTEADRQKAKSDIMNQAAQAQGTASATAAPEAVPAAADDTEDAPSANAAPSEPAQG
jgi:hypothetical protein